MKVRFKSFETFNKSTMSLAPTFRGQLYGGLFKLVRGDHLFKSFNCSTACRYG